MFSLKIIKANGSLIGNYKKLSAARKRLQSISDNRGGSFEVRVRGEVSDIPKVYTGAIMTVSALLAELPTP